MAIDTSTIETALTQTLASQRYRIGNRENYKPELRSQLEVLKFLLSQEQRASEPIFSLGQYDRPS